MRVFSGNKIINQCLGESLGNTCLSHFSFFFLLHFDAKKVNKSISNSVPSVQHPNADQIIQQWTSTLLLWANFD